MSKRNKLPFGRRKILKTNKRLELLRSQPELNQNIMYVALDSSMIFNMIFLQKTNCHKTNYMKKLKMLLNKSIFDKFGNRNYSGNIVFCVVPSVYKELFNSKGEMNENCKNFIKNRTVVLEIKKEYQDDFNFKVKRLVEGYNRFGYFLDEFGMPTNDGNIVAEASILNLIMLSRDNRIVGDNKENKKKQLKDRYEKIKFVNRKCLKGDFNGRQAEPKNLYEFLNMVKEGIPATSLNNFPVLSDETQRFMHCELHYQPNEHKKHHEDDDEFCL